MATKLIYRCTPRRGPADTLVVFNSPVNYLEPLRNVLDIVSRKPGNIVQKRQPQWRPKRSKDATWRARNGSSVKHIRRRSEHVTRR